MNCIYRKSYRTYDIYISETTDQQYTVEFRRLLPHGNCIVLDIFSSYDDAKKASEHFPKLYPIALEKGCSILSKEFINRYGKEIDLTFALDVNISPESFRLLFN